LFFTVTTFTATALFFSQSVGAALIPVVSMYPDIKTTGSDFAYSYNSGTGVGTLVINGSATGDNAQQQTIRFASDEPYAHNFCNGNVAAPGTPSVPSACNPSATYYSLTANFLNGVFQGGSLQVGGDNPGTSTVVEGAYIDGDPLTTGFQSATDPNLGALPNSGTILLANLTQFGFQGASDTGSAGYDHLIVDFLFDVTGGDLGAIGYGWGGLIWNGRVTNSGSDPYNTDWEAVTNPFGQKSFNCTTQGTSGCASQLDTFVPIPGALWLFISGILGLVGVARGRKR
jgi:hypothetical protein